VNCAGVATASKMIDAYGEPHSLDLWDFTISVNLYGTFNLTRLVCKHLVKVKPEGDDNERGVVIFVSSSTAVGLSFSQPSQNLGSTSTISAVRRSDRPSCVRSLQGCYLEHGTSRFPGPGFVWRQSQRYRTGRFHVSDVRSSSQESSSKPRARAQFPSALWQGRGIRTDREMAH